MMKCELTFVSGVQESVSVDFISQNKVKIKICQNCLCQKYPYKNEQSATLHFTSVKLGSYYDWGLSNQYFYILWANCCHQAVKI